MALAAVSQPLLPGVAEVLEQVPDSCENSVYAATTVAPDGMVYQGTLNGMTRYVPETAQALRPPRKPRRASTQALDLLTRSETDAPRGISERDYLRRAIVQLDATEALALKNGLNDVAAATALAMRSLDAAIEALDAGEAYAEDVEAARAALDAL